jgi:tetratricopeptide (TPR) repeat protein
MVIDGRHDHSFRLPRPDLSRLLGSPNACTQCHQNRKPEWAAAAMDKWYGKAWRERPHYGTVLHAGAMQGVKALPALLELAQNPEFPAVVRATAATLAAPIMRPELLPAAQALLQDADPSVRIAALSLLEPFEPAERVLSVAPLLADPVLGVRIEAGRVLADVPESQIPADKLSALHTALQKYLDSLQQDADWPAANVNLGNLALRQAQHLLPAQSGNTERGKAIGAGQGRVDAAITWYKRALALDPRFAGTYVNLADVYRRQGREDDAEKLLRQGLVLLPKAADLHHALGLSLVRKGDTPAALKELATAAKLSPDNARYAYVYAVGLHSAGKRREALAILKAIDARRPYDLDVLGALISMLREAGDAKGALVYARKAAEALPGDAGIKQLLEELEPRRGPSDVPPHEEHPMRRRW